MEKLSVDEVKHIAHLARIYLTDEEVETYRVSLAKLFQSMDEIHAVKGYNEDILIAPWTEEAALREDQVGEMLTQEEVLQNAPSKNGKFIEVPVMLSE